MLQSGSRTLRMVRKEQVMKSTTTTVLVAAGALLVGGIATAAFMKSGDRSPDSISAGTPNGESRLVDGNATDDGARGDTLDPTAPRGLEYADVLKVDPITEKQKAYATVIGTDAVRETSTTQTPHEVCQDVTVQERLPERDGNVGGTVVGAVVGGLLGNQVGGGNGKKLATVAGAVAGGAAGRQIQGNSQQKNGDRVVERRCERVYR